MENNNNENNGGSNMIKQSGDFENPLILQAQTIIAAKQQEEEQKKIQKNSQFYGFCKQFLAAITFAVGSYVLKNAISWTFSFLKKQIFGGGKNKLIVPDADSE